MSESTNSEQSRRSLLKLAVAGLGGAGLAAAVGGQPAAATDGQAVLLGVVNESTSRTTITTSAADQIAIRGYSTSTTGTGVGLYGDSAGAMGKGVVGLGVATGVQGSATSGVGVDGSSTSGVGVSGRGGLIGVWGIGGSLTAPAMYATGSGMIRMEPEQVAPPHTGFHFQGSMLCSNDGSGTWICVTSGDPGVWRKLAGPTTAGAFHAISPQRVYDSRHASALPHGHTRDILVANSIDSTGATATVDLVPVGATAVALNLSIAKTTGTGNLTAWPQGQPQPLSTVIQWTAKGQALTNGFTAAISTSRKLTVSCAGTGSTHLFVDVGGYYL